MRTPRLDAGRLGSGLVVLTLAALLPLTGGVPAHAADLGSATSLTVTAPAKDREFFDIGDPLVFVGSVRSADQTSSPTSGTAALQVLSPDVPTWTTIATDTSPDSLSFSGVTARTNASYKVVFGGGLGGPGGADAYLASESVPVRVLVARAVRAKPTGLRVVGRVGPDFGRGTIKVLRKSGDTYGRYTIAKTRKNGSFSFRAPRQDDFRFALVVPGDDVYARAVRFYVVNILA